MDSGSLSVSEFSGGFDLQSTIESAQSFLWHRLDGEMYEEPTPYGGDAWYYTLVGDDFLSVRQRSGQLEWRGTTDGADFLRRRLRLDDDLDEIFDRFPDETVLERAHRQYAGLRVVRDPFFPCLVSFICSARMSVKRIHALQQTLAREYGSTLTVGGSTYHAFPRSDQLVVASENDLRNLGLGFRAPYVERTTQMIVDGALTEARLREHSYEEAHRALQSFPGVGPKIADCVSLFALNHLQAVPIDTWTRRLIERYFPDDAAQSYDATAEAFRARFGVYAGYAQTYLFHYERS